MTNLFKKAAAMFGNWTGIKRSSSTEDFQQTMVDTSPEAGIDSGMDAPESSTDFIPLDGPTRDWGDALTTSHDSEAAVAQASATPFTEIAPAPDQPVTAI